MLVVKQPAITFTTHSSTTLTTVDINILNKEFKERICSPDKEIKFDFIDTKNSVHIESSTAEQYALSSWLGYLYKEPYSSKQKLVTSLVFKKDGLTLTCHRKATEQEITEQIKKILCAKFEISADEIQKIA